MTRNSIHTSRVLNPHQKLFFLKRSGRNINYSHLQAWALETYENLANTYKKTYDYLRRLETCRFGDGYLYIHNETIAKKLGYSVAKVERHIKKLVQCGLLWRHTYHRSKIAKGGSDRVMCTFQNLIEFRKKYICKYRKWAPLHKSCIASFEGYVKSIKIKEKNFCKEELDEIQAEIDSNQRKNQLIYENEKKQSFVYRDEGSISKVSLRDIKDNTIYINSHNSLIGGYQKVDDSSIIHNFWGMTKQNQMNAVSPLHEMELAVNRMCLTQPQFQGKQSQLKENLRKAWSLQHDSGIKFTKSPLHLAAHATINGYQIAEYKPPQKDYSALASKLRWGSEIPYVEPLSKKMQIQAKYLAHELKEKYGEILNDLGYSINEYEMKKQTDWSEVSIKYSNPYLFADMMNKCLQYGHTEITSFILSKLQAKKPQSSYS